MRLSELTSKQIQTLYSDLDAKGFSPNTIRLAHAPLRQALQCAVTLGLIPANPTIGTKRPKVRRVERQTLSVEQIHHLLETHHQDKWYALWVFLLFAGLRPGEAVGLKWSDFQGNRLIIRQSITELEDRKWGVGDMKTKESAVVITLPQITVDALMEHRERHPVSPQGWIFADDDSGFLLPDTISDYWRRLLRNGGLPAIRLYDTRHTHATLLLTAGVNPKVVSSRLRHASVAITLDMYSHVLPSIDEEAADTLDQMIHNSKEAR